MWWDPQPADFVSPQSGLTVTRALGQLRQDKCYQLEKLVDDLLYECKAYTASIAAAKVNPLLLQITQAVRLVMEQLRSIPSTYDRMVLGVTGLQCAYLELTGLFRYISIYKPRMENPYVEAGPPDDCIGVFTSDPAIAQFFRIARLPYWLIRPLSAFNKETILSVVLPLDPTESLVLEAAPGYPTVPAGTDLDQRIRSLHLCTQSVPWFKNPFASPVSPSEQSTASSVQPPQQAVTRPSRLVQKSIRPSPYKEAREKAKVVKAARGPNPAAQEERNKYKIFESPFMPAVFDRWADALAQVDRSQPAQYCPDPNAKDVYIFPEPALLVSSTNEARRQLFLHHYQLMHDALLYHLGDPNDPHWALPTQVWRDILQGKVSKQGRPGTRAEARTASIETVLGPALKACGIDELSGFLTDGDRIPFTTQNRAKEIVWEFAEMNFRFELLGLDARASGMQRPEQCRECFPGQRLLRLDIAESKQGFAAIASAERLPYLLRLAALMVDWQHRPRPGAISMAAEQTEWTVDRIYELESAVACYYTQCFYEHFNRAAVIPMRLEHEFGT
ncbi:hypothetical protein C8R44DRAFT_751432 [Mycena epipterygia]|nr:hypothetical protein C8R44DRAFT_751432 [Mycena epipterygia]